MASRRRTPVSRKASPAIRAAGQPGAKNLKTLLTEALNELVVVTENGGRRKITKREAIITQLVNRSATADLRAIKILLDMLRDIEGQTEPASARDLRLQRGGREGHRAAQGALLESGQAMIENLTRAEYEVLLRHDFATFAARCFQDLNPQTDLAMNWHLEVIAAKLTAVRRGQDPAADHQPATPSSEILDGLDRLSGLVSRARPFGPDPVRQLCPGSRRQARPRLPQHHDEPWYRRIFPTRLAPHRQAVQEFITTRQGYRLATSTGGVLTGRGADIILIDDPLKPEEALSEAQRQAANEWYDHTLYSRLNDKRHGAIVIIMQRLHEDDLVGHVLGQEAWEVLSFPAIAEAGRGAPIETIWGSRCFTRAVRARPCIPTASRSRRSNRIRRTIGEYNFAGQYQQSPAPLGGGLVKAEWFKRYARTSGRSASTASCRAGIPPTRLPSSAISSVCTTWGVKDKNLYLLGLLRQRLEYPALKRACASSRACSGRP